MKEWETSDAMFRELNGARIPYVILRNFEELDAANFYISGHADIDFLTTNGKQLSRIIGGKPRFIDDDGIHYVVKIAGTDVVIDTRSVGDGYYDTNWEKDVLKKRLLFRERFYIPDDENYYHTLSYHAILQKKALSGDYLTRLNRMASDLGIAAGTESEHLAELERYMKHHGYHYTLPYDIHVPLRRECIDQTMVKKYQKVILRDAKIKAMQIGSDLKHKIIK